MSHTHDDVFNFIFSSDLDHFAESRSKGIETLNTEPLKVGKLGNQKINKALISAQSLESIDSFLFTGLKHFKALNSSLDEGF